MAYFTQALMRLSSLNHMDIDVLVAACLLIASKFDEIDYNLPSFDYLQNSKRLNHFWSRISWNEYVQFEKFLIQSLEWNLNQLTPYHFLQALLSQGVVLSHERVKADSDENSPQKVGEDKVTNFKSLNMNKVPDSISMRAPYGGRSKSVKRTQIDNTAEKVGNSFKKMNSEVKSSTVRNAANHELKEIDDDVLQKVRETSEYF